MYHYKLFYHVEIFKKKKVFGGCKNQIFFIGDQMWGVETEWRRLGDVSERHGDSFMGPEGSSGNLEA